MAQSEATEEHPEHFAPSDHRKIWCTFDIIVGTTLLKGFVVFGAHQPSPGANSRGRGRLTLPFQETQRRACMLVLRPRIKF